jgi:hypothetical protein
MGLAESKCVKLVNAPTAATYLGETYTVIRTSGAHDAGWTISAEPHSCDAVNENFVSWRPASHAQLKEEGWRVFLINGNLREHSCGWRRLGTFWPTRLTGDQAAIDAWVEELRGVLTQLARDAGLPTAWHDDACLTGWSTKCEKCCAAATAAR